MFDSLGPQQLEKICQKAIRGVKRRLSPHGIRIVLEPSGTSAILDASYDRNYGARPVERYIEKTVVTSLSKMLLSGAIGAGCTIHIEGGDEDISENVYDEFYNSEPVKKKARTLVYRLEKGSSFDDRMTDE